MSISTHTVTTPPVASPWPPASHAPSATVSENGEGLGWPEPSFEASGGTGGSQAGAESAVWQDLVARARAAQEAALGGGGSKVGSKEGSVAEAEASPAAAVDWGTMLSGAAPAVPVSAQQEDDGDLANLLALLCAS